MNIALMTCNDKNYEELAAVTAPTKQRYCEKWGFVFEHLIIENTFEPIWEKPKLTLEMLKTYDAVIYLDCDAFIANQEFDIRPYIEKHQFIISKDLMGINAGVYIAKSTDIVKRFFWDVVVLGRSVAGNSVFKDQSAINHFLGKNDFKDIVTYMPQNFMNSYLNELYGRPTNIPGDYKPGDWIVHLPALPLHIRLKILKEKFGLE
jgi:hypothetical protein